MDTDVNLMVVFSKLSYQFLDKLGSDLESHGMSSSIYSILAHLKKIGKSKVQKLAEISFITSGTITHHINKLVKLDYVTTKKDEIDRRITWVEITPKGIAIFNEVNDKHMKYLKHMLSVFTNDEKSEFIKQLKYFGKTLQRQGESHED